MSWASFSASLTCSLNLKRTGRLVSPIYFWFWPFSWHTLQLSSKTTFFLYSHQKIQTCLWPPGHFGLRSDERTNLSLSLLVFPHGEQSLLEFLAHLNSLHPTLKFTLEHSGGGGAGRAFLGHPGGCRGKQ